MNNYNRNRFGDTSFRIKKQINFYQEIFQFIYEKFREIEDTKKDLDISIELELVKEYVFKNIVNYNEQKVSHGRIIIKQLEKFKLINFKNNQIFPTDIGKEVFQMGRVMQYKNLFSIQKSLQLGIRYAEHHLILGAEVMGISRYGMDHTGWEQDQRAF